jgi:hypothetical protein
VSGAGEEPTYTDPNRSDLDAPSVVPGATQDEPAMDQHDVSIDDKIDGIVAQTRVDVGTLPRERIADVLRQRLSDAGITASDDHVDRLAARVAGD